MTHDTSRRGITTEECGPDCTHWCPDHPGCGLEGCKMSIFQKSMNHLFGCPYGKFVRRETR